MSRSFRTNDGEYQRKPRDLGVSGLGLWQGETGITPPPPAPDTGDARRERILSALEGKRRDWIDRIHAALVRQLAANGYEGVVSANEARSIFLAFPDLSDEDRATDLRFLASLWRRPGWVMLDMNGKSNADGNHARRIARFRYDPSAAERAESAA